MQTSVTLYNSTVYQSLYIMTSSLSHTKHHYVGTELMYAHLGGEGLIEQITYPSSYLVLTGNGYTKHYYAGAERVAARLGSGELNALDHVIDYDGNLLIKSSLTFEQSDIQIRQRQLEENNLDCIMENDNAVDEFSVYINDIPIQLQAKVYFDYTTISKNVRSMEEDCCDGKESEVYFYHSDHLGSASWITDAHGTAIQYLQYLPFGEPFVNQHAAGATYSERFTFTGKERDSETGYSYFGARYYDSGIPNIFLSVDPMADKYPNISPYAYCAWNPVKLVDPDGEDIWEINQEGKIVNRIKTTERDAFYIVDGKGNRMMDETNKVAYKSISFKYGSVKEFATNGRMLNQTGFNISDNSSGADLFKFMADNTSVEYGLVTTKESGAYLLTNHDNSKVGASSYAAYLDSKGNTITSVSHNHPNGSEPSGFNNGDNHGDKFNAQRFSLSKGHTVKFFVYSKKEQNFTRYNGLEIQKKRDDYSSFKSKILN